MYIDRFLEEKLLKYLNKKEIFAIVGPRQCGKTTLMEHLFKRLDNAKFITFEDREALELFTSDIKAFVELYIKETDFLFIDEFQYAKEGGKQLKYIYDIHKTKIIISGSSSADLTIQGLKYLVGRVFVFNLYPLSFGEYLNYKNNVLFRLYSKKTVSQQVINKVNDYYKDFAVFGGYPRVALSEDDKEKIDVLKNIYNTYFLKEIKEILQLKSDFKLAKLIKLLSLQLGSTLNYDNLSTATGFDYKDLLFHLNVLQKTFVCVEGKPFFTNKSKELVKAPKMFFLDNGFRNTVVKDFRDLNERTDKGMLNENFVASELAKKNIELKYWRTKSKAEIDFVVESEGNVIPIEVKSHLMKAKLSRSFMSFLSHYRPKKGFVFSNFFSGKKKLDGSKISFVPLACVGKTIKPEISL